MKNSLWHDWLSSFFQGKPYEQIAWYWAAGIDLFLFVLFCLITFSCFWVVNYIAYQFLQKITSKTAVTWDDEFAKSQWLKWFLFVLPVSLVLEFSPHILMSQSAGILLFLQGIIMVSKLSILLFLALGGASLLNIAYRIYERFDVSRSIPLKGVFQIIKLLLFLGFCIWAIAILLHKSPLMIFSGLGAMTAVILLIFRDSLLGLVAGVQLSANRMVATGDWIEMPKFGADGDVLEVALTTVKVRNWDKTITTVPTYALISDSFKNWRGMSSSGVRRIKRSIFIDMQSIGFLSPEDRAYLGNLRYLKKYLEQKQEELQKWNEQLGEETLKTPLNGRALTNIGTFRAYAFEYLANHPKIAQNQTLIVRQLQPTKHGLPLEIYAFTSENGWSDYEGIQSDIFDHLFSALPYFGLRIFQELSDQSLLSK